MLTSPSRSATVATAFCGNDPCRTIQQLPRGRKLSSFCSRAILHEREMDDVGPDVAAEARGLIVLLRFEWRLTRRAASWLFGGGRDV
jgi:hypothetical protein